MAIQPAPETPVDFDTPSKKGWEFFTKFLTVNVALCIAALLLIGLLTVWR
ncbi:hypothetical protein [Acidocella aromatica]|uniref:Uncharacterized protein n=1 Tax=Acidocella aromatica TaxID=1303579 RepID=A0A840VED5_9PROT|nr:hypothetical protein [Acidocella aromatica]MBB5374104.1 hypothetical protein [Acidocella aromatica]